MCVPYSILRVLRPDVILDQVRSRSYDVMLEVMFDAPTVIFYDFLSSWPHFHFFPLKSCEDLHMPDQLT